MPALTTARRCGTPRPTWVVASALVALALAGCSAPDDTSAPEAYAPPTAEATVPVLQPGMPGEPARTLAPEDAAPPTDGERWSPADAALLQQMVTHHRQAVEMSALAPERAGDPDVVALAERIGLGQEPEIQVMVGWLEQREQTVPPERSWLSGRGEVADGTDAGAGAHGGHGAGSGSMAGMASAVEVQQLADARGEEFDALFVELMVRHHRGAIAMVEEHAAEGVDVQVREMADEMTAVQTAEIAHLESLRPA